MAADGIGSGPRRRRSKAKPSAAPTRNPAARPAMAAAAVPPTTAKPTTATASIALAEDEPQHRLCGADGVQAMAVEHEDALRRQRHGGRAQHGFEIGMVVGRGDGGRGEREHQCPTIDTVPLMASPELAASALLGGRGCRESARRRVGQARVGDHEGHLVDGEPQREQAVLRWLERPHQD